MQNPRKLLVAGKARELAANVYNATRDLPREERFGLTSQMRRAAVSIGANIWEGCGRRGTKEFAAFLHIALGSASELEFECLIALDAGLASDQHLSAMLAKTQELGAMLSRLIVRIRTAKDMTRARSS